MSKKRKKKKTVRQEHLDWHTTYMATTSVTYLSALKQIYQSYFTTETWLNIVTGEVEERNLPGYLNYSTIYSSPLNYSTIYSSPDFRQVRKEDFYVRIS